MCSYFQDGLKTIEHFHCYIEELVVQLGRLKQKQDAERRNLIELRDVLRTFMSSYREVKVNTYNVCLFPNTQILALMWTQMATLIPRYTDDLAYPLASSVAGQLNNVWHQ